MMKNTVLIVCLISFLLVSVDCIAEVSLKSTEAEQTEVSVTVYNDDLALIKDVRGIKLPSGSGELRFMDVASGIMPVSVHARSLNHQEDFNVLEQNYEYDLINADKLLDKYVGKKIKIMEWNKYQNRKNEVEAELLSNNGGQIYRINDEIYLGHAGTKVIPEMPEDLIAKPTLTWLYENKIENDHTIEVSYLTNNIGWKADYVLSIDKNDELADIAGWVTIDNRSGATYRNANLKLIAGKPNRVRENRIMHKRDMDSLRMMTAESAPQFTEKSFSEYHIYDLQRKTTIKDKQMKQISFMDAFAIPMKKELIVRNRRGGYFRQHGTGVNKIPVTVYIKFENSKQSNMGMPLPAGVIRVYKSDDDSSLQFIGEDNIVHTPKDEEIRLKLGDAFDVVAEKLQTDYKKIGSALHESEWKITIRNHKDTDISVGIEEEIYRGDWDVINNSHPYKKIDAFTMRFDVNVPANNETIVNYKIRVNNQI